jgi:hypothetical protein
VAWPTLFVTHSVPAALGPIVAALAAWPLLLVRINPLLGWAISAGSAVAIPLFFDRLPTWSYPWQVVHLIELLVLIVAVASIVLFFVAMPVHSDSGWAFGVSVIVFVTLLVRWLVLSRQQVARLEEVSDLERARHTVLTACRRDCTPNSRRSPLPVVRLSTRSAVSSVCCAATPSCPSWPRRRTSPICPICSRRPNAPVYP